MGKICRACGNAEHFTGEITDSSDSGLNLLSPGFFRVGKLRVRICGACGLVDLFVPERFLEGVRKTFVREP